MARWGWNPPGVDKTRQKDGHIRATRALVSHENGLRAWLRSHAHYRLDLTGFERLGLILGLDRPLGLRSMAT